jgi:hypothetical protein
LLKTFVMFFLSPHFGAEIPENLQQPLILLLGALDQPPI